MENAIVPLELEKRFVALEGFEMFGDGGKCRVSGAEVLEEGHTDHLVSVQTKGSQSRSKRSGEPEVPVRGP